VGREGRAFTQAVWREAVEIERKAGHHIRVMKPPQVVDSAAP